MTRDLMTVELDENRAQKSDGRSLVIHGQLSNLVDALAASERSRHVTHV